MLGLVVLQVVLGIASHSIPGAIVLHALNAFAIFLVALTSARRVRPQQAAGAVSVPAQAVGSNLSAGQPA